MEKKSIEKLGIPKTSFQIGYRDKDGSNELELKILARKINEIVDILNSQLFEAKLIIPGIGESEPKEEKEEDHSWYKPEIRELIRKNLSKIHLKIGNSYGIDVSHLHKMISEYAEQQRNEAREIAVRMVLAGLIIRCEIEKKGMVSLEFLKSVDPQKLLKTDRD